MRPTQRVSSASASSRASDVFQAGEGSTSINVRSLWFLLAYASDVLPKLRTDERELIHKGEHDADLLGALGTVLLARTERRLRTMLSRGYVTQSRPLTRVRGRVDHLQTASRQLMKSGRIQCVYSEHTVDLPRYRYLHQSLRKLSVAGVETALAQRANQAALTLERLGVTPIEPSAQDLAREPWGRSDAEDRDLVALCRLIRDMCVPEHRSGASSMPVLKRDEGALRALFEKAIKGYLTFALRGRGSVHSPKERWPLGDLPGDDIAREFFPEQRSDVVVDIGQRRIVIECKFGPIEGVTMFDSSGPRKLKAGYIRQLFTYCQLFASGRETSGVLLAARTDSSTIPPLDFTLAGIPMKVRTVDLSQPPLTIRAAFDEILLTPNPATEPEMRLSA